MATKKKKLQLKTVTYGRLKNLGNFENERLEATATIADGDDPKEVVQQLKAFVKGSLKRSRCEIQEEDYY